MKWRRLTPGRKTLARRFRAAVSKHMVSATLYGTTFAGALASGCVGTVEGFTFYTSPSMRLMDRRQWRRHERNRKRAGL